MKGPTFVADAALLAIVLGVGLFGVATLPSPAAPVARNSVVGFGCDGLGDVAMAREEDELPRCDAIEPAWTVELPAG